MRKVLFIVLLSILSFAYADEHLTTVQVPEKYYQALVKYCRQYNVPMYYASRLISYESGWDPKHRNKNKNGTIDISLCQLNSAGLNDLARWHNDGKKFDPTDWETNLRIGIAHMRFLYDRNGKSWWAMVASYNMGETAFREWCKGKRPLPAPTQKELNYVFS